MAKQQVNPAVELAAAVAAGRRQALEAIRDRLAAELVRAKGAGAAAVAKELRATVDALANIPEGEVSKVDELARRRAARRAEAAGS